MCYNFRVKSKVIFTISLCAAFAAAGVAAYANSSPTYAATSSDKDYPLIFTEFVNENLDGLVDFATDGKSYAFADRNGIIVVKDEERTKYDIKNVSALDYYNGTYFYKMGSNSHSLPTLEPVNYEFSTDYSHKSIYDDSGKILCEYKIHTDGKCYYLAKNELNFVPIEDSGECYKLKVYNKVAYALIASDEPGADGKITVKQLNGTECKDVNPSYIDFTGVEQVALGSVKDSFKSYNLEKLHFSRLKFGSYYTEINIDNLSGEYFDTDKDKTYKCGDDDAIRSDEVMLILGETGESGKTKVFTHGGKCYMAHTDSLQPDSETEDNSIETAEFTDAYINAPDFIYSSPFLVNATKTAKLSAGDEVKVKGKLSNVIVGMQFYKIEYGEGDEKTTGYVLSEFLRPFIAGETEHPDDKNFGVVKDPDYSEDDYVKIAVLLLIVVVLVLIGLSYITYVLTNRKHRMVKQIETEKTDEEDKKE